MNQNLIYYRHATPQDLNFVISTWKNGLYYGNPWFQEIDEEVYKYHYTQVIDRILSSPETSVLVACLKEDPDVIIGYSVTRNTTLDWVHVKPVWRKLGIGRKLVPTNITQVTHLTKVGRSLKPKGWKFNPFITIGE